MSRLVNVTKVSEDIAARLRKDKKYHLLPIYHLLRMSKLGREAIENNGSFRFADHVYGGRPDGTNAVGKILDRILLNLPSARSFRNRYLHSRDELHKVMAERTTQTDPIDILAVPSGLARELFDVASDIQLDDNLQKRTTFHFIDLDNEPLSLISAQAEKAGHKIQIYQGDAFEEQTYNNKTYDAIVSLGFVDFLNDEEALAFYTMILTKLKPGGKFITSGLLPHKLSDYLMRQFAELHTSYRSRDDLIALAETAGYNNFTASTDQYGLQTLLVCTKQT
jgi:hypothetical protein